MDSIECFPYLWAFYQIGKFAGCPCRGGIPRHPLEMNPTVSDPGMHYGTCVTHVPWCMSGSLTRGGGGSVPGIPGACTTRNFTHLVRGPWKGVTWVTPENSQVGFTARTCEYAQNVQLIPFFSDRDSFRNVQITTSCRVCFVRCLWFVISRRLLRMIIIIIIIIIIITFYQSIYVFIWQLTAAIPNGVENNSRV